MKPSTKQKIADIVCAIAVGLMLAAFIFPELYK